MDYVRKNETDYDILKAQLEGFIEIEDHFIPVLANASALVMENLEDLNWAGFYLTEKFLGLDKKEVKEQNLSAHNHSNKERSPYDLILGPFNGKNACVKIAVGNGVCGTAVKEDKVMLVKDVNEFPGHIACDSASNSEIVLPIHKNGEIIGLLDIDSPYKNRFSKEDEEGLLKCIAVLEEKVSWER